MSIIKNLIRYGAPFVNVGTLLRGQASRWSLRKKPLFIFEDRSYSYEETYQQAIYYAHLFQQTKASLGKRPSEQLQVGLYLENCPEFLFAYFGAALTGDAIFGINTGFRGEVLREVVNGAELDVLLTEPKRLAFVMPILPALSTLKQEQVWLVKCENGEVSEDEGATGSREQVASFAALTDRLHAVEKSMGSAFSRRPKASIDNGAPFLIIYTSGTTGVPKGVVCPQFKLVGVGVVIAHRLKLKALDRGYVSTPLFHSNAFYLGVMPALIAGGSFVLKRKFSARAFAPDILKYGCTFMNYVGQPIHYILGALEREYGSEERLLRELATHPQNKLQKAVGNGATPVDREKFKRYLGMYHIYELYGSTEAAISTFNMPGDPIDSVGEVSSKQIFIADPDGKPCPPGRVVDGRLVNYEEAVGEIVRRMPKINVFFDGYYKNEQATHKKFRDGLYRSGDLGHIREINGKRYLYFNGRTDDWIRKDGENFSAENVTDFVCKHPDVALGVAFGVPCAVSDERVMAAVQLKGGTSFSPQGFFDFFAEQVRTGGMDPKWFPDYIRVVEAFELTETQKIIIRGLKRQHFDLVRTPDMEIYVRRRGDTSYHRLDLAGFEALKREFETAGRASLLENY